MRTASALRLAFVGIASLSMTMGAVAKPAPPPYCVGKAIDYADTKTGSDSSNPLWNYYFDVYAEYNDCFGEFPCNNNTIMCQTPPD